MIIYDGDIDDDDVDQIIEAVAWLGRGFPMMKPMMKSISNKRQ